MITLDTLPGADGWGRAADFADDPFESFYAWCYDHGYGDVMDADPVDVDLDRLAAATAAYGRWQEAAS